MVPNRRGAFALFTCVWGNEETCIMGNVVIWQKFGFCFICSVLATSSRKCCYFYILEWSKTASNNWRDTMNCLFWALKLGLEYKQMCVFVAHYFILFFNCVFSVMHVNRGVVLSQRRYLLILGISMCLMYSRGSDTGPPLQARTLSVSSLKKERKRNRLSNQSYPVPSTLD